MSRLYHHRVPGAKFYMPDGREICFAGGNFDSAMIRDPKTREAVEGELNKIANVPSSQVYTTDEPVVGAEEAGVVNEIRASATASFDGAHNIKDGTTVEIPVPKQAQPVISQAAPAPKAVNPVPANKAVEEARAALAKANEAKAQAGSGSSS